LTIAQTAPVYNSSESIVRDVRKGASETAGSTNVAFEIFVRSVDDKNYVIFK